MIFAEAVADDTRRFSVGLSGKAPVPSLCKEFCAERVSIRPQPAAEHVQELHVPHKASLKNASHHPCFGQLSDSSGLYFHFDSFLPLPVISFLYCIVKTHTANARCVQPPFKPAANMLNSAREGFLSLQQGRKQNKRHCLRQARLLQIRGRFLRFQGSRLRQLQFQHP